MRAYETLRTVTRLSVVCVLAAVAGFLGFSYDEPLLVALFETLLAVLVCSWVYVRLAADGLSIARSFAPRASEDEEVHVALRIRNRFWLPVFLLEIRDWFAADALPLKRIVVQRVSARSSGLQVEYSARCLHGRGRFEIGPLEVTVSDPLGIFQRRRSFHELGELVVYPRTFPIRDLGLKELMWRAPLAAPARHHAGQAATFLGTREYRPGDNVRHIHWFSTARHGSLILKEFENDTDLEVTIFLDLCKQSLRGLGRGSNIEYGVRIAASIADHVTQRLFACQLIADPGPPVIIPPSSGEPHLIAILDTLAQVRPTGQTSYLDLVSSGLRFVTEGGTVVLLFASLDFTDDALDAVVAELLRRGSQIIPVVMDEGTFLAIDGVRVQRATSERRLAALVRRLGAFGVRPVIVRAGDNLEQLFANPVVPAGKGVV